MYWRQMKFWKFSIILIAVLSVGSLVGMYFIGNALIENKEARSELTEGGSVAGATTISNNDYLDRLTRDLTDKGAVLYCSFQVEDCQKQKEIFGDSINNVNYVECDAAGINPNSDECIGLEIQSYPTWRYQERKYTGIMTLSELAKLIDFSK